MKTGLVFYTFGKMEMIPFKSVIEAIHASPTQAVLCVSGGASQALGWLMCVPGASSTVLEVMVPYSRPSMINLLRKAPTSFTAQETSDDLALVAYNRALKLAVSGTSVLGIGFSGALETMPPKRGNHRCFLSARTSDRMWRSHLGFSKGLRKHQEEDTLASQLLIKGIAVACNIPFHYSWQFLHDDTLNESEESFGEDEQLEQLLSSQICMKVYSFDNELKIPESGRRLILPGSFNPLHEGHIKLMEVASSICRDTFPCFEISVINADKPPLTIKEIKERVKQFEHVGKTVIITNQPYFYKKAELFPNSSFIVGADTVARLLDPKYYGNDHEAMKNVLLGLKETGCEFLVGGRVVGEKFLVLRDFDIPEELEGMFKPIPKELFRMDISSTEIRKKQSKANMS